MLLRKFSKIWNFFESPHRSSSSSFYGRISALQLPVDVPLVMYLEILLRVPPKIRPGISLEILPDVTLKTFSRFPVKLFREFLQELRCYNVVVKYIII